MQDRPSHPRPRKVLHLHCFNHSILNTFLLQAEKSQKPATIAWAPTGIAMMALSNVLPGCRMENQVLCE